MALIKAHSVPPTAQRFSMTDIEQTAKRVLVRAQRQAEALLSEAQVEAEALRRQAAAEGKSDGHQQGYAQGLEAGRQSGHAQALEEHRRQFTEAFTALTAAATGIDDARRELEADALSEVIHLAVTIARRVTRRQAAIDPGVLADNLKDAMTLAVHCADPRIAVNPGQKATLEALLPQLQLQWPALRHVQMLEDPAVAPGGCRIYSRQGMVDADLDGQIDRIVADLLPQRDGGTP